MYNTLYAALCCGLGALSGIAAAQPTLAYDSAYSGYKAHVEEPVASWREVNDEAARVGGHAGIFSGAMHHGHGTAKPAEAAPAAKPPAAVTPPPAQHGGHH